MSKLWILLGLLLLCGIAAASTLSISNVSVNLPSTTGTGYMVLDSAPAGLSGCNITLSVANGSVATLAAAYAPYWSTITSAGTLPGSSITFSEADLTNQITAGATNVPIVNVSITGITAGSTTFTIVVNQMDDDVGGAITPTITNGTITINAAPTPTPTPTPGSGPIRACYAVNTTLGDPPLTVQFTDTSAGSPADTWLWDFGDGNTSTEQNPVHTYAVGWWDVHFTASNSTTGLTDTTWSHWQIHVIQSFTRVTSSTTITPVSTHAYNVIINSFGGNRTPANESEARINFTQFLFGTTYTYTDIMGNLALVIIFAIPFILMWLMQSDLTIPGIIGIILGGFLFIFLPAEWHMAPVAFIALSIVAIIYGLYMRRE